MQLIIPLNGQCKMIYYKYLKFIQLKYSTPKTTSFFRAKYRIT